jgi:hypothetical protein
LDYKQIRRFDVLGKSEINAVGVILASKPKVRRLIIIVGMLCLTAIIIAVLGFYSGAITWHGK